MANDVYTLKNNDWTFIGVTDFRTPSEVRASGRFGWVKTPLAVTKGKDPRDQAASDHQPVSL